MTRDTSLPFKEHLAQGQPCMQLGLGFRSARVIWPVCAGFEATEKTRVSDRATALLSRLDPSTLLGPEASPSYSPWPCSRRRDTPDVGGPGWASPGEAAGRRVLGVGGSDRRRESRASRGFTLLPGTREPRGRGDAPRFTSRQEQGWEVTFCCKGETPCVLAQCPKRSGRGCPDRKPVAAWTVPAGF